MTQTLIKKADTFEPEEMADILLLLKSGDVDIARHAWHSYMWSARLTEVLEVHPTDFSDETESGVHGVHQVSDADRCRQASRSVSAGASARYTLQ